MLEKQRRGLFVDVSQLALSSFANNLFHEAKKWCQIYCRVYRILCIILYVVGKIYSQCIKQVFNLLLFVNCVRVLALYPTRLNLIKCWFCVNIDFAHRICCTVKIKSSLSISSN